MRPHDAFLPTQPTPASLPPPLATVPRQKLPPWATLAAVLAGLVVGLLIGIAIGRATASDEAPAATTGAPTASNTGRLKVSSKPADGNVVVDGRFVGVSPIERIDLDPGKHSIVIDVFGYQPYAGTLEIEPHDQLNLTVLLAAIGARDATTTGSVAGGGGATKATKVAVPASALLPATAAPAPPPARATRRSESSYTPSYTPAPAPAPPARPRRDCSGEKSTCRDHCSRASFDCNASCPGCVSCSSSVGWDECHRQCNTCRSSCDQNTKFCETSCDSGYSNCQASQ